MSERWRGTFREGSFSWVNSAPSANGQQLEGAPRGLPGPSRPLDGGERAQHLLGKTAFSGYARPFPENDVADRLLAPGLLPLASMSPVQDQY